MMRFFTMEWWGGGCGLRTGGGDDLFARYQAHVAEVRGRLPAQRMATLDALESVAVHDARLRDLRLRVAEGTLEVKLDAYWEGGRMTLSYAGVRSLRSTADPEVGLGGPAGYGDLGYWEVDLSPQGALLHRLLFSTGIELEVEFTGGFEFRREGTPEPG